jgi:hypothetical protein
VVKRKTHVNSLRERNVGHELLSGAAKGDRNSELLYDAHFRPVVGELAPAVEADYIVSGSGGSDGFPIADGASGNAAGGSKRLGGSTMTAGEGEEL